MKVENEFEKRWICDPIGFFNSEQFRNVREVHEIRQGYLSKDNLKAIRIRSEITDSVVEHSLFIKANILNSQGKKEYRFPITDENEVDNLYSLCSGIIIEKMRYYIEHGGRIFHVDSYTNEILKGLVIAEFEYSPNEDITHISPPASWKWVDVTDKKWLSNAALSSGDITYQGILNMLHKNRN